MHELSLSMPEPMLSLSMLVLATYILLLLLRKVHFETPVLFCTTQTSAMAGAARIQPFVSVSADVKKISVVTNRMELLH